MQYKLNETRRWWFGDDGPIVSNWSFLQKGHPAVALRHEWEFGKNGQVTAKIKQYEFMDKGDGGETRFGKLIKEQDFVVENFSSINWVLFQDESKRIVAKFEPSLWSRPEPSDVGRLPINSGRMTIFDQKGDVWAARLDNTEENNVYFGASTHRGSFYISFVPFKGAKEIGLAEKGRIRIEDGGTKLSIESAEPFLPKGTSARVFGLIDLNKRTERLNSVSSFSSDSEANFIKSITSK